MAEYVVAAYLPINRLMQKHLSASTGVEAIEIFERELEKAFPKSRISILSALEIEQSGWKRLKAKLNEALFCRGR